MTAQVQRMIFVGMEGDRYDQPFAMNQWLHMLLIIFVGMKGDICGHQLVTTHGSIESVQSTIQCSHNFSNSTILNENIGCHAFLV